MNITPIDRQKVLGMITAAGVDYWQLLQAVEWPRWKLSTVLKELAASKEITVEHITDDDFTYPVFRLTTLWDMRGAA